MDTLTKPGYKQTELGWIPEDWEIKEVKQLGSFKKGKGIRKDQVSIDGLGCVRYGELYTHYNSIIKETKSFIPLALKFETQKIEYGDILFAGSGETKEEIGKCAAFLGTKETYAGGDIVILSPKKDNSSFLGYLLNQTEIAKQKAQFGQGDAVVHIYPNGLGKVKIPLPPLPEQTAIATALSDMDSYIGSLEKLIAKKRMIKQGAMQELLTPKEDWEISTIGDCFIFLGGAQPDRSNFVFQERPGYVRLLQIRDYKTDKYESYIPESLARRFCTEGDIMIGRYGPPIFQILKGLNGAYNVALIKAVPTKKITKKFGWYLLKQEPLFEFVEKLSQRSSGQTGVDLGQLKGYQVCLPSIEEKNEIVTTLSDMDVELESTIKQLQKARELKQGMMQELLTGKVRLV